MEAPIETPANDKFSKAGSLVAALLASRSAPWRAKSVLLAFLFVLVGGGFWVADAMKQQPPAYRQAADESLKSVNHEIHAEGWQFSRPLPLTVRLGASYIGGFFIGWLFRRFIGLSITVAGVVLLLAGFGKFAGCNVVEAEKEVKASSVKIQHEAKEARDYLKSLLPSASSAAVGVFLGFRRRDTRQ